MSSSDLLAAVIKERRLEFICEGIRGVDIIRRGENFVKKVGDMLDVNIAPTDNYYYWPIPESEKKYNKTLGK